MANPPGAMLNPLASNPLQSRADLQQAVRDLYAPLRPHASRGKARIQPASPGAGYTVSGMGLEGFARPLWGIAPLAAGGGAFEHWPDYHLGLAHGADPAHPEYWGDPPDADQRFVEHASLGFALALAPEHVWQPLSPAARHNLVTWLQRINRHTIWDNNWLFFRVLANVALKRIGQPYDAAAVQRDLDRLDEFYLGDGWYSDGPTRQRDYYIAFAMHFYGLIYAKLEAKDDPARAEVFRERAARFALDYLHFFTHSGMNLPFGRSLIYRFAAAAFWAALPFADVQPLSWAVIKGFYLRNLRTWAQQPIFHPDGVLSVGYAYPNLIMAENYNGPGAPYWAMKSFLPLALPESHPFWQCEESPAPPRPAVHALPHAGMLITRDPGTDHVWCLSGLQHQTHIRHAAAKYGKFAYSTHFGFCVGCDTPQLADSTLALSEDGQLFFTRGPVEHFTIAADHLRFEWRPRPWLRIETQLTLVNPTTHHRRHTIITDRRLTALEGGFGVDCGDEILTPATDPPDPRRNPTWATENQAALLTPRGYSAIKNMGPPPRAGQVSAVEPNLNLLYPRAAYPFLRIVLEPGEHVLECEVTGAPAGEAYSTQEKIPAPQRAEI